MKAQATHTMTKIRLAKDYDWCDSDLLDGVDDYECLDLEDKFELLCGFKIEE